MSAMGAITSIAGIVEVIRRAVLWLFDWRADRNREKQIEQNEQEQEQIKDEIDDEQIDDLNDRWGWSPND